MIINLTRKTVISNRPNFRLGMFVRAGIIPKNSFLKSDCLIFQNCATAVNISRLKNIEVIFTDSSNSVCRIIKAAESKIFLHVSKALTTLILPDGTIERSMTQMGDIIDLSAELSSHIKNKLIKNDKVLIGIPGTAMIERIEE